jgi:hypothetical protein
MVLERATEEAHAVGEKRRGQRVARMPEKGFPVEGEREVARAVDQPAGG